MSLKNNKCVEAYNALGAYNLFKEFNRWPRLKRALNCLTEKDWKELKRECPEQYLDMRIYALCEKNMIEFKDDPILKMVNVKINHPKSQLQNMVDLVEVAFCFGEPGGNKEVVETGKLLIKYIGTQDKRIKHYKLASEKAEEELKKVWAMWNELEAEGKESILIKGHLKWIKQKHFPKERK